MIVASANEFRVNQRKYLDLVRKNVQVFIKQGEDLFAITPVGEQDHVDYNPEWVAHVKKGIADTKAGRVIKAKSSEIWEKVSEFEKTNTN